ncbi:MAG: S41 family peptidase [Patescibacteria group bacterium]
MQRQRLILIIAVIAALCAGFGGGYGYFRQQNAQNVDAIIKQVINKDQGKVAAVDFSLFWQVWDKLHDRFVDKEKLDSQKLVYGAIEGMVAAAGDPYTVFFEPVTSKKFQEEVSGAFSGVGMEIGKRNDVITVIAPIKDSPAMRAGIKAGDVVVKVDDMPTDSWSVEEAVSRIRGKKGTTVKLTLAREGEAELIELSLARDTIRVPAVDWRMLDNKVAYLEIYTFNGNLDDEFARAAKELTDASAQRLIIDMRNNPGGLLDSAVNLAGWMLKKDSLVVQERYGTGLTDQLRANGNARLSAIPTVVLINGGSASAAEILAGALHDIRKIPLVGEKSFGKGSVQQLESFYNGASLKVTVAKWLTPNGVSISETGIAPTDEVKIDPKEYKEKGWEIGTVGKDPQLDKAIAVVLQLR